MVPVAQKHKMEIPVKFIYQNIWWIKRQGKLIHPKVTQSINLSGDVVGWVKAIVYGYGVLVKVFQTITMMS